MYQNFVKALFLIYRWFFSPAIHLLAGPGQGCRFRITCSEYSFLVFKDYGLLKGCFLTVRRILSCHPFSKAVD